MECLNLLVFLMKHQLAVCSSCNNLLWHGNCRNFSCCGGPSDSSDSSSDFSSGSSGSSDISRYLFLGGLNVSKLFYHHSVQQ